MERLPHNSTKETEPGIDNNRVIVDELYEKLSGLATLAPDAFELFGGTNELWHIDELPLNGSADEREALTRAINTANRFVEAAQSEHSEERMRRLNTLSEELAKALFM